MKNITNALIGYFKQHPDWMLTCYIILACIAAIYIGTLLILKLRKRSESPFQRLMTSLFMATNISMLLLVAYTVYSTYFNSFIYKNHLQSVIIILLILHILLIIFTLKSIFKAANAKEIKLIGISPGPAQQSEKSIIILLSARKLKMYVLLPILPFVLLFLKPKENYLYSIVFDNSASMELQLGFAKDALKEIVNNLNDNSSFVVSSVPVCNNEVDCLQKMAKVKRNLNAITNVGDTGSLLATTNTFNTKLEFYNYVNAGGIEISGAGSSIYECVWQNFMESVKMNDVKLFTKKKVIILTDGNDNLYAKDAGFIAPTNCIIDYSYRSIAFSEFYNDFTFISYGDGTSKNMFNTCTAINVLDGFNYETFKTSFYEQLQDVFFDKQLLWIVAMLLFLAILIIFTVK